MDELSASNAPAVVINEESHEDTRISDTESTSEPPPPSSTTNVDSASAPQPAVSEAARAQASLKARKRTKTGCLSALIAYDLLEYN